MTDAALVDALQLMLIPKIGPATYERLIQHLGSPTAVLEASAAVLEQAGLSSTLASRVSLGRDRAEARQTLQQCEALNIRATCLNRDDYPVRLKEIDRPPPVLFIQGSVTAADQLSVAIVGSRSPSVYGEQMAKNFAGGLARAGVTIVSGLARGVDGLAHRAALEAGGRTLAVLGGGINQLYPREHIELARQVVEQGALISEYAPDVPAIAPQFPQRNRIISGLSLATLVIEASEKSGSLHTARHAMEQHRDVLAVPGRVDSDASKGCLKLIRDGAILVRHVEDVLEALGHLSAPVQKPGGQVVQQPRELLLNDQEQKLLQLVGIEATPVDTVLTQCGLEYSRALSTLTVLEIKKLVRRLPGNFVVRIS
ncbi:DNA protecting protein DprA [Planctopirus limnophila DSM 3776]|uniref:DNA protecting protein DprA n=1 Tax=Planctopirus limnophila (strain ATCC 43296 / DSM 3776 / IFAM 1008 / Mu 290) TaxID=521674 RepID=D5SMI2_PLAL2|nr:DNA-processing protein DprA [Planctopirus limnophila]ADG65902.1 DNA protecting protein DprA [Planctopirus limnophila DSM 3776]